MSIHQIQVRYDPAADRLLLQLNTTEAELFQVWLTRRMLSQFYPAFRRIVVAAGVAQAAPMAVPVPEARRMLEDAAMQRPLAIAIIAGLIAQMPLALIVLPAMLRLLSRAQVGRATTLPSGVEPAASPPHPASASSRC